MNKLKQKIKQVVPGLSQDENVTLKQAEQLLDKKQGVDELESQKLVSAIEDEINLARQSGYQEANIGEQDQGKMFWLVAFNGLATLAVVGMLYMVHFA